MKLEERTRDEKLTPPPPIKEGMWTKLRLKINRLLNLLNNIYFSIFKTLFSQESTSTSSFQKRINRDIRETRSLFTLQSNIALFGPGFALAIDLPTFTSWSSNRFRSVKGCEFGLQIIRYRSILYTSKLVILSIDYLNDFKISIDQK